MDGQALLREAGIDTDQLKNPNHRIPVSQMTRLWELAIERTGDPCFALSLAEHAQAEIYSALGISISLSATVGDALQRMCQFSRIATDAADLSSVEGTNGTVEFIYAIHGDVAAEAVEAFMTTGFHVLQQISDGAFRVLEVHFRHDNSAHLQKYENFFQANVVFSAAIDKFIVEAEILQNPCHYNNQELAASMEAWMVDYLASFADTPLSLEVRRLLTEKLPEGPIEQSDIAAHLAMSTRALQRTLQQEGNTFRELIDVTRHDLALKYMSISRLSLVDICGLLGFSDQSNFTRAFRRWTGQTPAVYRKQR